MVCFSPEKFGAYNIADVTSESAPAEGKLSKCQLCSKPLGRKTFHINLCCMIKINLQITRQRRKKRFFVKTSLPVFNPLLCFPLIDAKKEASNSRVRITKKA